MARLDIPGSFSMIRCRSRFGETKSMLILRNARFWRPQLEVGQAIVWWKRVSLIICDWSNWFSSLADLTLSKTIESYLVNLMKPTEIFRNSLKLLEPFETLRSSSYLLVCTEIAFSLSKSIPKSVYKSLSKSVWLLAQPACRWSFTNFRNFHSPMSGCSWSDCLAKRKP